MTTTSAAARERPVVQLAQGRARGVWSDASAGIALFAGLPYARPPVGALRWRPPQAPQAWAGERDASAFGPWCPQATGEGAYAEALVGGQGFAPEETAARIAALKAAPGPPMDEDCLYLNVRTPMGTSAPAPVMVWIHGGAHQSGSGAGDWYQSDGLVREGVVLVTINYRLNLFGYFSHPALSAESPWGRSGNYGLMDILAALEWVRDNIAAFGGDPGNVTIFGESAGSWAVNLLVANHQAKGLFHKAIGQSGAFFYSMLDLKKPTLGRGSAEAIGQAFGETVAPGGALADLRALPAHALLAAAAVPGAINPGHFVVVDGQMFAKPVRDIFAAGEQNPVPVMAGFNADEGSGLSDFYVVAPPPPTAAAYEAQVKARFGDLARAWLKLYPASDLTGAVFNAYRDSEFGWRMQAWAGDTHRLGQPAYLYFFNHTPPGGEQERGLPLYLGSPAKRRAGAFHASEIAYVFNNAGRAPGGSLEVAPVPTETDTRLADQMSDYWVAFATRGDPNGPGRPVWTPYSPDARHYMEFAGQPRPGVNLMPGMVELHEAVDARRMKAGIPWDGASAGLFAQTLPLPTPAAP